MSAEHSNADMQSLAQLLGSEPDLLLAVVFGSVARGDARPDSDLDVAVLAVRPLTAERRQALVSRLASDTGRPVDLVDLRTAGVLITREALTGGRRAQYNSRPTWTARIS